MTDSTTHDYDDIINLPYPGIKKRAPMSMHDRAAQFAPFAALTGFGAKISETARLTDQKRELSEEEALALNVQIRLLRARLSEMPEIEVTYFVPDAKKEGGAYVTVSGKARKIDDWSGELIFTDGRKIKLKEIHKMQLEIFNIVKDICDEE